MKVHGNENAVVRSNMCGKTQKTVSTLENSKVPIEFSKVLSVFSKVLTVPALVFPPVSAGRRWLMRDLPSLLHPTVDAMVQVDYLMPFFYQNPGCFLAAFSASAIHGDGLAAVKAVGCQQP